MPARRPLPLGAADSAGAAVAGAAVAGGAADAAWLGDVAVLPHAPTRIMTAARAVVIL